MRNGQQLKQFVCFVCPLSVIQCCKDAILVGLMWCRFNRQSGKFIDVSNVKSNLHCNILFLFASFFYCRRTRIELIMARTFSSSNCIESVEAIKTNWSHWRASVNVLNCKTIHRQRQFNSIKCLRSTVDGQSVIGIEWVIFILIEIVYVQYERDKRNNYIFGQWRTTSTIAAHYMRSRHTPLSIYSF